ncbi:hypothetical protein H0H93_013628 [Arthromyces matolae]|nr:hypothetical protein H0H93_013628 [Arthromyces matolae]
MQRRSKRLRTAPQPDYGPDSDDDTPDSLDASFKSTSRAKSKNSTVSTIDKGKRTVRGRRGQLETVFQLPLDVLFEIFAQLTPLDLLNLSRTSKSLRDILMRRSSQYMWKSARAQVEGLPDCPNDMSEPAYANLVFYPYCQVCHIKLFCLRHVHKYSVLLQDLRQSKVNPLEFENQGL